MALQDWLTRLEKPIEAGLSSRDLQQQYNQMRKQIQGSWGAGTEALKSELGGRGFRVGESGFADTPLAQMYSAGSEALSRGATDVYLDEARRRQDLAQMNLNRLLGAGGLETQAMGIEAQKYGIGAGAKTAAEALAWEKERFGQQFPWEKEQAEMGNLFNLMGMMGASQQQVYAPWFESIGKWGTQ